MPEATFLCIDSSDFMRNGDYSPNRMMAVQEACSLLIEALMQRNPENVIGFLTFGGKACSVRETLTEDIDRVSGSLASIAVGGESHFAYGVQIAMLALSHVKNTRSQKHVCVFVGSPITDGADRLKQLATALRKDEVGVSIISLGCPDNTPILQEFTSQVQKNAHLYVVPENGSVIDFLFTTALMGGDSGAGGGAGGVGATGGQPGGGFGGNEADDPEFAAALRASLEEEQRRQAAAASGNNSDNANAAPTTTTTTTTSAQPVQNDAAPEDDLELALRLSMEEALRAEQQENQSSSSQQQTSSDAAPPPASTSNTTTTANANSNNNNNNQNDMAEFEAAIQDPEVMKMLEDAAKDDNDNNSDKKDGEDKK